MKQIIGLFILVVACSILVQVDLNLPFKDFSLSLSYGVLKYILTILIAITIGLLAAWLETKRHRFFRKIIVPYGLLVLCGLMVTALAQSNSGWPCNRWVYFGPFSIQPSEFLRLAIAVGVVIFAIKLERSQEVPLHYIGLIVIGLILLVIEGDLSTLLLLTLTIGAALYYFGQSRWIGIVLLLFILVAFSLFILHMNALRTRLPTAWDEPKHQSSQEGMALISIRTAPVFGHAINPRIEQIPLGNRDFFFAKSIRTYGRAFGVALFLSCLWIPLLFSKYYLGLKNALSYNVLCLCWAAFCVAETLLHVYVNLLLVPVMGVNLPFASLGGSAMLVHLGVLTFLLSLSFGCLIEKNRGPCPHFDRRGQYLAYTAKVLSIIALIRLLLL